MSGATVALRILLDARDEDLATAILWERGTQGLEVRPAAGDRVALLSYFPERDGLAEEIAEAVAGLRLARVETVAVPAVDWVARFREGFRPFGVGSFRIAPCWDAPAGGGGGRVLLVDPGRAFGTGTHETTRLCLLALEERAARRGLGRVLDVGTGSGILAVAAALLGATGVCACDRDEEVIAAARQHARLNRVDLRLLRGDGARPFASGRFDVVVANLTAPLLRERNGELAAPRAAGGALVLSGFLRGDLAALREAYAPWGPLEVRTQGEWAALLVGPAAGAGG